MALVCLISKYRSHTFVHIHFQIHRTKTHDNSRFVERAHIQLIQLGTSTIRRWEYIKSYVSSISLCTHTYVYWLTGPAGWPRERLCREKSVVGRLLVHVPYISLIIATLFSNFAEAKVCSASEHCSLCSFSVWCKHLGHISRFFFVQLPSLLSHHQYHSASVPGNESDPIHKIPHRQNKNKSCHCRSLAAASAVFRVIIHHSRVCVLYSFGRAKSDCRARVSKSDSADPHSHLIVVATLFLDSGSGLRTVQRL